ncbi:hypothetical protein QTP81_00550 [Alteromonas sp. ASW11-36]|uniref:Secreted protein n=1 Tax=Alteromonas arenosi TaxID=3055817 RepID=A0ABT7SSC9_9ALTE|nr:hypothetical protein [Alteromonas sp. ASW11-36]MDM7859091.1 hypothetical protein [Alteromonas sp. ASW11-36]
MKTLTIKKPSNFVGLVGAIAITFLAGCQSSQTASTGPTGNSATAEDDDGVICKMERRVGSNMMTRVCRTAEQRAAQEEAGREGMLRLQRGSMTTNADG